MTRQLALTNEERDFFRNVAQAAFANPFSQTRVELDRKIAGSDAALSWDDLVELAISRIVERLSRLRASGRDDLARYGADDRELLKTAFLFDIYHRYRQTFDDFILKQLAAGDEPIPVPFARELLGALAGLGLDESGCRRYLVPSPSRRRPCTRRSSRLRASMRRAPCSGHPEPFSPPDGRCYPP